MNKLNRLNAVERLQIYILSYVFKRLSLILLRGNEALETETLAK